MLECKHRMIAGACKAYFSTALRCEYLPEKISKKSTCVIMIRIIVAFANQIFL